LINFQRRMWDILRVETSLVSREQWLIKRFTTTMGVFKSYHRKLYRLGNKKSPESSSKFALTDQR
jgi:hypothetical protein